MVVMVFNFKLRGTKNPTTLNGASTLSSCVRIILNNKKPKFLVCVTSVRFESFDL